MTDNNESCCCCFGEPDNRKNHQCPSCGTKGTPVNKVTVQHLLLDEISVQLKEGDYALCMNASCETAYFSHDANVQYQQSQVKIPLWFKENANPKYVCYCSQVTEEQVEHAVKEEGATTLKEVIEKTGAMDKPDCLRKNPLGTCCHETIQEAIDKVFTAFDDVKNE